jgi:sirohydrochlorin cobaltochelatase
LWEGMGFGWAEVSYSGVAYPLVDEGMKHAMKLGYKRIIVFPYFLFTGIMVRRIYAWADEAAAAYPDVEVLNASYLNDHTQLLDCFVDRIEEALVGSNAMNCLLCKYREQIISYKGDECTAQVLHHHNVSGIGTDGHGTHDHDHGQSHDHSPKD